MTKYDVTLPKNGSDGYGIKITKERYVEDISPRYSVVKILADTCNREDVEAEQFDDVLENFLSDFTTF